MSEREEPGRKIRAFFEDLWQRGDHWDLETSEFEQARYVRQLRLLQGRRWGRVLEIGCAAGHFTRMLAPLADTVVALDVAEAAIERARAAGMADGTIDFRAANVMEYDAETEGPWDLIVLSETIYYLGWLYPFFDVAWLGCRLFLATRIGGKLLLANTWTGHRDYLALPWLLHTYRDLFRNVGYQIEKAEVARGSKNDVEVENHVCLFQKPGEEGG